ncbi:MAG: YdeI/OmpD-associated family protein, partial [Solirubrobacteraceae bacterium]
AAGDSISVDVQGDDAPRTVDVPEDLASALAQRPAIKERFDALSYSNRKRLVLSVAGAKTEQTRARRIQKVLAEMSR